MSQERALLDFETARERLLADAPLVGNIRVPVAQALNRVLAVPVVASAPHPPFDTSAMDGYALNAALLTGPGPWTLDVVGESQTGHPPSALAPGTAMRIFTGAEVPPGANAVEMQENVTREGARATFPKAVPIANNVRLTGTDIEANTVALEPGTRLGAFQLGLIASLDIATVTVRRAPRVAIVCTGDELRNPGEPDRPGSIPESNGIALSALAETVGAEAVLAPLTGDNLEATASALEAALRSCDLLLTVGGVSVGDHDLVRPALEAVGVELDFWKVAIKPGKPLAFGKMGDKRVLGLPGNPISAQLTASLFAAPLLRAMQGDTRPLPTPKTATLTSAVKKRPGRLNFVRAVRNGDEVTPLVNQASGAPTGLAWANSLVVAPRDSEGLAKGERVSVLDINEL